MLEVMTIIMKERSCTTSKVVQLIQYQMMLFRKYGKNHIGYIAIRTTKCVGDNWVDIPTTGHW